MANKKITELQLISTVTDSLNYPVDDTLQTYRSTASQLYTYLKSKLFAESSVTPDAADPLNIFDASASNAMKLTTVGVIRNAVYRAVTTTDAVGTNDETMVLSGASFTSTLPTAVGVAGKRYKFLHSGTSLSQVYTIATTSSQTVSGLASAAVKLIINGQVLEVESDGANWIIVNMYYPDKWTTFTPTMTNMNNITSHTASYRVKGDMLEGFGRIVLSGAVAGDVQMAIPSGLTIDTTRLSTAARADLGNVSYIDASDSNRIFTSAGVTYNYGGLRMRYASSTTLYFAANFYVLNASQWVTWASGDEIHWNYKLPISTVVI
jgi:hypothetical protein